jgi:hypothetical protein
VVFVEVPAKGDVTLAESFKVTEALETVSPGAEMLETVSGPLALVWADDSSEDGYELRVYDTFGQVVFEDTDVPRVTGAETASYELNRTMLEAGTIYQFRVHSWRENKGERRYISATEDLRGTFQLE